MSRSGIRRGPITMVIVLVLAVACGSDEGSVLESTTTQPEGSVVSQTTAESSATTVGQGLDVAAVVAAGGDEAAEAADELDVALERLQAACSDPVGSVDAIDRVTEAVDELRSTVGPVIDRAGPEVAGEWYDDIEARALLLAGCADIDPAEAEATDLELRSAGLLMAALDRLYAAFDPDGSFSIASRIWQSSDQLHAITWMRDLVDDGDDLHTLIIGPSTAKRAFDPTQLSDGLGVLVGNAAIRSGSIETTSLWLDEILSVTDPERVIIGVSMFDLYANCRLEARAEPFAALQEKRRQALAPLVGWDVPMWSKIVGPLGATSYDKSPLLSAVDFDFVAGTRGLAVNEDELVPERVDEFIELYGSRVMDDDVCSERFEMTADVAAQLMADGREVVVVAVPALDDLTELHPDGVDGWRNRLYEEMEVMPEGVRFIDLSAPLPRELFNDTWHVTNEGRRVLTDALLAEL